MKKIDKYDKKMGKILRNIGKFDEKKPSNEAIDKLVFKAKEFINSEENENRIGFIEFIALQIKIMKKELLFAQMLLLFFAGYWLSISKEIVYMQRGLSVLAALFVIFIIPELWKNIENKSMEIEKSSLFDLRRVYAAKLIAFGLIDTGILTVFCVYAVEIQKILVVDLLGQFVFPIMISSIICMMAFSRKRYLNQFVTMIICLAANMGWMLIILNDNLYLKITPIVWILIFIMCALLLFYFIQKVLHDNTEYLEGKFNELSFE